MKKLIPIFLILVLFISITPVVYAQEIVLPNGTKLNIDNLTDYEVTQAINTAKKSMAASADDVVNIVKNVDPENLNAWRKLITGTIKDVCNDLSLTANDFVKTPVGLGISALIIYKVAGEDLLRNALDIIIMVPLWFIITGLVLFFAWKFFSFKTYYDKIYYDDKGKKVKERVARKMSYEWDSDDAKCGFAWTLVGAEVIITIVSVVIILT